MTATDPPAYTGRQLYGRVKVAEVRHSATRSRLRQARRDLELVTADEALYASVPREELEAEERAELDALRRRLAQLGRHVAGLEAQLAAQAAELEQRRAAYLEHRAHAGPSDPDAMIPAPRRRRDIDGLDPGEKPA